MAKSVKRKIEKVYLLNPVSYNLKDRLVREGRCMQRESSWSNLWQPLTLCVLKPWLKQEINIEGRVRDATANCMTMRQVIDEVKRYSPDMVVINTAVPSITREDLDTAAYIKKESPDIFVVMIGIPATVMTDVIFKDPRGEFIDACVHHECEQPLADLIKAINSGKDWKKNNGIAFKKGENIVYRPTYPAFDINRLPFADFTDLPLDQYTLPFTRERVFMIENSRGCNNSCTFCVGKEYYTRNFRFRNPKQVVDELEYQMQAVKAKAFLFWADSWMTGGKKAMETCDEILKRGLNIKFLCNARVDAASLELLQKMKKSGCMVLAYGVESCVQEILDNMAKGVKVEQISDAIKNANRAGVPNSSHVVVGLPGETWDTVKLTTERLIRFNPTYMNAYCPVPYPGTPLYELAERKKWLMTHDWTKYEELHAVMRNEDMTTHEIEQAKKWMTRKFYIRPRVVAREVKRAIIDEKSLARLYYLGIDGTKFMSGWVFGGESY